MRRVYVKQNVRSCFLFENTTALSSSASSFAKIIIHYYTLSNMKSADDVLFGSCICILFLYISAPGMKYNETMAQ